MTPETALPEEVSHQAPGAWCLRYGFLDLNFHFDTAGYDAA